MKLTEGTSLQPVDQPVLALDVACNEMLTAEKTTAKWIGQTADTIVKEVCDKGFDALAREFRTSCARFGRRTLKVSKKIDESHAQVLKCHRSYQNCYQTINQTRGSGNGGSSSKGSSGKSGGSSTQEESDIEAVALSNHAKSREASGGASMCCLWTVETAYTRACTMYEMYCSEYRHEMSQLYLEYQTLELDRLTKTKTFIQLYLNNLHQGFNNVVNDVQFSNALAASTALDPQKEVVVGLNMLNQNLDKQDGSGDGDQSEGSGATSGGGSNNGEKTSHASNKGKRASAAAASAASASSSSSSSSSSSPHVAPPPPLQSRLVLKSGTLLMKAGLLRSWKPHHAVLTADGYLHLFDPSSLLEKGSSSGQSGSSNTEGGNKGVQVPPTYEPTLTIDILASVAVATPSSHASGFDVVTNTKGFLGLMNSTRTQSLRAERNDLVETWVDSFGRIRRLVSSEIATGKRRSSK